MNNKDTKLLWGRAASRCSICKVRVSEAGGDGSKYVVGEQAHIVGEKEGAARFNESIELKERNSYHNIILLCPTHHTMIDNDECTYTVAKLHQIKSEHELWVEENLSTLKDERQVAIDMQYSYLVDLVAELCWLSSFEDWISLACSTSMILSKQLSQNLAEVRKVVFKTTFLGEYKNLEKSIITLSESIGDYLAVYHLHSRMIIQQDMYQADRFYKLDGRFNPDYDVDLDKYNRWERAVTECCFNLARSINWFLDEVRSSINPLFLLNEGKMLLHYGPNSNMDYTSYKLEFEDIEKLNLPESFEMTDLSVLK
jgi:hypothetical protein